MTIYTLDPLEDPRWFELVQTHPAASVFHTPGWLQALRRTYDYDPVVYTTCPPGAPLTNGIVVCRVSSWLTGRRLVSLPFADHCDPLVQSASDAEVLVAAIRTATSAHWKYAELRPRSSLPGDTTGLERVATYQLHTVDLRPELEQLHRGTHASAIQRKIRRAEREGLQYAAGRSEALLDAFCRLQALTRRRHGVPPPPREWFANLTACLGDAVCIRVASKGGRPIGSIMTLQHDGTLVYKYGGSDASFHNLGTMPFLFWRAIEDAKARGLHTFDLGRTDEWNTGLMIFKERLGGVPSTLAYVRCSARPLRHPRSTLRTSLRVPGWIPQPLLALAGRILYRHIA